MKTGFFFLLALLIAPTVRAQSDMKPSSAFITPFNQPSTKILSQYLDKIADSSRIIGLGEVSHYTKECYELKHAVIKQLMKRGYLGLILEVDFGQALIWNNYVVNGTGNLDTIVAQSGWFTYRTEEFKQVLQTIRTHNQQTATPFQVFGMEMTAVHHNIDWLIHYFSKHTTDTSIISSLKKERKIVAFYQYTPSERQEYWSFYYELLNFIQKNEQALEKSGGKKQLAIAQQIIEIMRQYASYISQDDYGLKSEFRDQFSARNVWWTMNQLGEDSKVVIWAHNGHIAKESILFNYDILGHYLTQWFGDQYYAIGFSFNSGEFGAFSNDGFKKWEMETANQVSYSKFFHSFESPYLFFDIRQNLREDQDLNSYLRHHQPIRTDVSESYNGTSKYMDIRLSTTYDALIYIEKTSYPTTIDWLQN